MMPKGRPKDASCWARVRPSHARAPYTRCIRARAPVSPVSVRGSGPQHRHTKRMAAVDLTTHATEMNAACAGVRDGTEINW